MVGVGLLVKVCLGDPACGAPMDVWAVACVTFEMVAHLPMFQGINSQDSVCRIFEAVGLPTGSALEYFAFLPLWAPTPNLASKPVETLEVRFSRHMPAGRARWLQSLFALDPRSRPTAGHAFRTFVSAAVAD